MLALHECIVKHPCVEYASVTGMSRESYVSLNNQTIALLCTGMR